MNVPLSSKTLNDLSKNVRDTFMDIVNREANPHLIKSCYFPEEAVYIISLPEAKTVFVFDIIISISSNTIFVLYIIWHCLCWLIKRNI